MSGTRASDHDAEISRIETAYRERDSRPTSYAYSWQNPAYQFYLQQLEWELLRMLRDCDVDLPSARVLDLGCGSGYHTHRLVEFGAKQVVGLDLMEHRIEQARRRYPTLDVRQGDATSLPFGDGEFDLVTQFTVLSSVLDPEVRRRIGSEVARVLAPGGIVVSFDMRPAPAPIRAFASLARLRARRSGDPEAGTPVEPLSVAELSRIFATQPLRARPVVLHPDLVALTIRWPLVTEALRRVPGVRSHLVAAFRPRPAG